MSRHLNEYNRPPTQYQFTTRKASWKRRIALLLLIVFAAAFLLLAVLLSLPSEPEGGAGATATAFAMTATAFAGMFLREGGTNTLTLPEVQATSTALFRELQTAQPLLSPSGSPEPVATFTPEP